MKKIFPAIILALLFCGCSADNSAEEMTSPAKTGLAASVTGEAAEEAVPFEYRITADGIEITAYTGDSAEVVVPSEINGVPVRDIAPNALLPEGKIVKKVTLPDTLERLPVFGYEYTLSELALPSDMTGFDPLCISCLFGLERITVYDTGNGEARYASYNGALYSADMKTLVFAPAAFYGELVIPEGVETLGSCSLAFSKASGIVIPSTVREIPEGCVMNRSGTLTSLTIPSTLEKIDPAVFAHAVSLEKIAISGEGGKGNFTLRGGALYTSDMKTLLFAPAGTTGTFAVPEGVETLGENSLLYADIDEVIFPSSLRRVGKLALANEKLKHVVFNEGLTEICENAFAYSNIEEALLPDSLLTIGKEAFSHTPLTELYIPDNVGDFPLNIIDGTEAVLCVPRYTAEMLGLEDLGGAVSRGDSALDIALIKGRISDNGYSAVFTDMDGDNFPERISFMSPQLFFDKYSPDEKKWKPFPGGGESFVSAHNRIGGGYELLEYCENTVTGEKFWLGRSSDFHAVIYCLFDDKLNFVREYIPYYIDGYDENGDIIYAESGEQLPPYRVISSYDFDGLRKKYGINIPMEIYDGPFADEPCGKTQGSICIGGAEVSSFPYIVPMIPVREKILINGKDIIRNEIPEGITYDYYKRKLTLDNVKLRSEKLCIDPRDGKDLNIELIGDNELISDSGVSVLSSGSLTIYGDGALTVSGIKLIDKSALRVYGGARLVENGTGIFCGRAELSDSASVSCTRLIFPESPDISLSDNSALTEGDTEHRPETVSGQ